MENTQKKNRADEEAGGGGTPPGPDAVTGAEVEGLGGARLRGGGCVDPSLRPATVARARRGAKKKKRRRRRKITTTKKNREKKKKTPPRFSRFAALLLLSFFFKFSFAVPRPESEGDENDDGVLRWKKTTKVMKTKENSTKRRLPLCPGEYFSFSDSLENDNTIRPSRTNSLGNLN